MKRKSWILCVLLVMGICILPGCQSKWDDLPEKPMIFVASELSFGDEGAGYRTIEYQGKVYVTYGKVKSKDLSRDFTYAFGDCLGYVGGDQLDRIYALANESTDEWLIEYYIDGFMEGPVVLREISTKGSKRLPEGVVESFDYDYWK